MIKRNFTDRVAMYRWAAIILSVSVIRSIYTQITETLPSVGWRVVLWVGWTVLMVAVARDLWGVYKAKREMHEAIERAINGNGSQQEEV